MHVSNASHLKKIEFHIHSFLFSLKRKKEKGLVQTLFLPSKLFLRLIDDYAFHSNDGGSCLPKYTNLYGIWNKILRIELYNHIENNEN